MLKQVSTFILQGILISNLETAYTGGANNPKTHKNLKFGWEWGWGWVLGWGWGWGQWLFVFIKVLIWICGYLCYYLDTSSRGWVVSCLQNLV